MIGWQLFVCGILMFLGVILKIYHRSSNDLDNIDNIYSWMPFQELLSYNTMILFAIGIVMIGAALTSMHI